MSTIVDDPTVSVIAMCFNHERFLVECLDSIRGQTYQGFELIIMDDKSTDDSVEIIGNWISSNNIKCKFVAHSINLGVCKTLNEAISLSTGDLICMISTDDRWRSNRIESHLDIFRIETSNDVALVYSDTAQINESGQLLPKTFLQMQRPDFEPPSGRVFEALIDRNFVHPLASTIRRRAIIEIGGYDERLATEDYDMWLRLSNKYPFIYSREVVSDYRIVSTSITRTLFGNPTAGYAYGLFVMCDKWVSSQLLNARQKIQWTTNQANAAYWLYYHSDPRATRCLWEVFLRTHRAKFLLLAMSSMMGITRGRAKRIASFFNRT